MVRYQAKMAYSPQAIEELSAVRFDTFRMKLRYLLFIGGGVCMVLAMTNALGDEMAFLLLVAGVGGLFLNNGPARQNAKQSNRSFKKMYPVVRYVFEDDDMQLTAGYNAPERSDYKDICLLVSDKNYDYLFLRNKAAYMIDKSTITPQTLEAFEAFVAKRTKLTWVKRQRFLRTSLKQIKQTEAAGRF